MGFFDNVDTKGMSSSELDDLHAIKWAIQKWRDYKDRMHDASEKERLEAEEALSFLKANGKDPT